MDRRSPDADTLERTETPPSEQPRRREPPRDLLGSTLGHYEVVERLGAGGMGVVYRAIDVRLGRPVALKVLAERYAADDRNAARLLREARSAAALNHPNVVAVYDADERDGLAFITMELVDGVSLRAVLRDGAKHDVDARVGWLRGIAEGLAAAHRAGIVHGDLKPENVMVRSDGLVKVVDFGIARRRVGVPIDPLAPTQVEALPELPSADGREPTVGLVGTPAYMAPEQLRGAMADAASDQFAWGVLAYELLTGELPWNLEGGALKLALDILQRDPPDVRTRRPEVPAAVAAAIATALRKDPRARAATMADVAAMLTGEGGSTLREGHAPAAPVRGVRRARLALAAAALAVALIAALGLWWQRRAPRASSLAPSASAAATGAPPRPESTQRSSNVAAQAAFEAGIQALRDAATDVARRKLDEAIALDPSLAPAHLWRAFAFRTQGVDDATREHLRAAGAMRGDLTRRERAVLDALELFTALPRDEARLEARMQALLAEGDGASAFVVCKLRYEMDQQTLAIAACREAARRDPQLGAVHAIEAMALGRTGDDEGCRQAYRTCLDLAPSATICLGRLALLEAGAGRCDNSAALLRQWVAIDRDNAFAYRYLAWTLYASGAPIESYEDAAHRSLERTPAEQRRIDEPKERFSFHVLEGRFQDAARDLDAWRAAISSSQYEGEHFGLFDAQDAFAAEMGDRRRRVGLARTLLAERGAWLPDPALDTSMIAHAALYKGGAMPIDEFRRARDEWLAHTDSAREFQWDLAYAYGVTTKEDAIEAIDALSRFPIKTERSPADDRRLGHVYMLGDRIAEATPYLRRAARACSGESPFATRRAAYELADALARQGDDGAACAALEPVLRHWGEGTCATCVEVAAFARAHGCQR